MFFFSEPPEILRFTIIGLFGERDITIRFDQNVLILVAENGSAKTTLLHAFYAVLTKNFRRLVDLEFDAIELEFRRGEVLSLRKSDFLITDEEIQSQPFLRSLQPALSGAELQQLVHAFESEYSAESIRNTAIFKQAITRLGWSSLSANEAVFRFRNLKSNRKRQQRFAEHAALINNSLNSSILYYPTYRRIEEDLENFGISDVKLSGAEALIQFGMRDVIARIETLTSAIRNASLEWFARTSGEMLNQLADGLQITPAMRESIADLPRLRILLGRIGPSISEPTKTSILNMVEKRAFGKFRHNPLIYFLSKLMQIYDQLSSEEQKIKSFISICNNYLVDKVFIYDESRVDVFVQSKASLRRIPLERLSSGEKQIVSLFSRLYLESVKPLIILFDEPELSLSIEWQRRLLPDIIASNRCALLLATTHSPFIFENSLDKYATDLSEFYTRRT